MGIYLGIDYGEKRVGIAVSDDGGKLAFPKAVLPNDRYLVSSIKDMCKDKGVVAIVVGESLDLKGAKNPIMDNIERFKSFLEKETKIEVVYEQEFFTSHQAEQSGTNTLVDASAAALILQSYLDKKNN